MGPAIGARGRDAAVEQHRAAVADDGRAKAIGHTGGIADIAICGEGIGAEPQPCAVQGVGGADAIDVDGAAGAVDQRLVVDVSGENTLAAIEPHRVG